jgi:hypothetical protein
MVASGNIPAPIVRGIGIYFCDIVLEYRYKQGWSEEKEVRIMAGKNTKVCAVSDQTLLRDLSRNPEVICARCGAKSHDRDNVCEPVAIEPDH